MRYNVNISSDITTLNLTIAESLVRLVHQKSDDTTDFSIALAGGNTPRKFYQLLTKPPFSNSISWGELRLFFGDERMVPPTSFDSNYKMVNDNLLSKINIDPLRVHRIDGEMTPADAAKSYDSILRNYLPITENNIPQLDLVLLGLGADGHIASLFPDTDILNVSDSFASAVHIQKPDSWRVSLTYPIINNAKNIWILVAGETKQDIVDKVFNYPSLTDLLPVERLSKTSNITWFMDSGAAHWLS